MRFRAIIDQHAESYNKAPSKYDKMTITKNIYEFVSQSSRFLKFNEKLGYWEEISAMAARDKVGHALRFATRRATHSKKSPVSQIRRSTVSSDGSCTTASTGSSSSSSVTSTETVSSTIAHELDTLEKSIYGMDSFVAQFQNSFTTSSPTPTSAAPQVACQTLLQYLSMENEQESPHQAPSADELKVVFDEFLFEDRFASMKDDLLQMVESMSGSRQGSHKSQSQSSCTLDDCSLMIEAMQMQMAEPCFDSKESLASLMMEPLGDWQD